MTTSQFLVLILAAIAFSVFVLLLCGVTPWLLIVIYWLVLTLKNLADLSFVRRKGVYLSDRK